MPHYDVREWPKIDLMAVIAVPGDVHAPTWPRITDCDIGYWQDGNKRYDLLQCQIASRNTANKIGSAGLIATWPRVCGHNRLIGQGLGKTGMRAGNNLTIFLEEFIPLYVCESAHLLR